MYENIINRIENDVKSITIKKRNKKTVKKDLDTAVDSLLDEEKESTAVLPTKKSETEKTKPEGIPDLRDKKKIKKKVVIDKPVVPFTPPNRKKQKVVWL